MPSNYVLERNVLGRVVREEGLGRTLSAMSLDHLRTQLTGMQGVGPGVIGTEGVSRGWALSTGAVDAELLGGGAGGHARSGPEVRPPR